MQSASVMPVSDAARPTLALPVQMAVRGLAGLALWKPLARLVAPPWRRRALEPMALVEPSLGIPGAAAVAHFPRSVG